jgi:hypothetical protein
MSPHFILGQLQYRQHHRDLARHEFEQVLALTPSAYNQQQTLEKIEQQKEMARAFLKTIDTQSSGKSGVAR